jgi:N6-adenosine-specific RNA methylase IME4
MTQPWSTIQHLDQAMDILRSEQWGRFAYASHYVWRKPSLGLGRWTRSVHEVLLIGTRGNTVAPALGTQWESVIDAPRGDRHSAKPDKVLQMIEEYYPNIPKIELNRRGAARPGWLSWGNEAEPGEANEIAQAAE